MIAYLAWAEYQEKVKGKDTVAAEATRKPWRPGADKEDDIVAEA